MAPTIAQLHKHLQGTLPGFDDILYGRQDNNALRATQIYDTPQGFWGARDGRVPEGHSERLVKAIHTTAMWGETQLDLVTMNEPKGEMWNAFVRAIVDLACAGHSPTVRIMLGRQVKGGNLVIDVMLGRIADALRGKPGKPLINMAQFRWETKPGVEPFTASWNHAKIIAADGRVLLTGGHNLWSDHYLGVNDPIFDISAAYFGPIARGGHMFANGLWAYMNKNSDHSTFTYQSRLTRDLNVERDKPADMFTKFIDVKPGSSPALWVSNPGLDMFATNRSSGLSAFEKALDDSTACRLSLQDLGGISISGNKFEIREFPKALPFKVIWHSGHDFNLEIVDALARFLKKGGRLELVLTSPESGGWNYSNHVPISAVFNVISKRLNALFQMSKLDTVRLISSGMYLHNIAFRNWRKWPSGSPRHNHAKFWLFDDELFYIGSENLYPSTMDLDGRQRGGSLQEFGVFLQDKTAAKAVIDTYYQPMFNAGWRTDIDIATLDW
ncbi:MAG TPA: hypothetical protein VFV07_08445 [Rhizomicrobium sp.]|nr:hypothetical protein [Rhizomicrobium sp.]